MKYAKLGSMKKIFALLPRVMNRPTFANVLMLSFILFTAIGGFLIAPPIGFIVAGVTCGVFGYLLGAE
jgi:LytS/YehU family sensor histidine kinase